MSQGATSAASSAMSLGGALSLGGAALGLIKGGIDFFSAKKQLKEDEQELAGLTPAFYKIQDEYYGNRNNAAELAQGGLTVGAKDYYTDQASRGLGTGISATLQAGGSPNDIARIFDSYNQGIKSVSTADSEAQINNIKYFHQVNKDLAGQKTTQWGVNEYQPYQNKLKELTQRIAADKINKNNAINSAIGGVSSAGVSLSNEDLLKKLFSTRTGAGASGGEDAGVTIDNGLEDPYPSFNPEVQGQSSNWYMPQSQTPSRPADNGTAKANNLSQEQIQSIMEILGQANLPKE